MKRQYWVVLVLTLFISSILFFDRPSITKRSIASTSNSWSEEDREFYLTNLINTHDQLIDYDNTSSAQEIEFEVGDYIFQFIKDSSNSQILTTTKGRALVGRMLKLKNWLVSKMILNNSNNNERDLSGRILQAYGRLAPPSLDENISQTIDQILNYSSFLQSVSMSVSYQNSITDYAKLRGKLYQATLETALNNLTDLEYYLSDSSVNISTLVNFVCTHPDYNVDYCGESWKRSYSKIISNHLAPMLQQKIPKWGASQGTNYINQGIDEINISLNRVVIGATDQDKWLSQYTDKYFNLAASGPGLLMMTPSMQYQIGAVRRITTLVSSADSLARGNYGHLKPHYKITTDVFKKALMEAKIAIRDHILRVGGQKVDGEFWEFYHAVGNTGDKKYYSISTKIMTEMVMYNPIAVARSIMIDSSNVLMVKHLIDETTRLDKREENLNNAYVYSSLVIGLALTATGVGASIGGWLLAPAAAGTLAAGTAATLGTVGTVTTVAGIVMGLGDATYYSFKAIEAKKEKLRLEQSILSGANDKVAMDEARKQLTNFRTSMVWVAINLGFSINDIVGMVRSFNAAASATCAIDDLTDVKKLNQTVDMLDSSPEAYQKTKYLTEEIGSEKTSKFMGFLSRTSDAIREKILHRIADSSLSPESFKIMAEESLQGLQGASGCI